MNNSYALAPAPPAPACHHTERVFFQMQAGDHVLQIQGVSITDVADIHRVQVSRARGAATPSQALEQ